MENFITTILLEKNMLLDILLAMVLGFAIGFERELTNKWAGLRTHMLVCMGSCIFTLLSIHAFPVFAHSPQADPARIAAQVLTGIGFIGGGTVLKHGSAIYGLTTAAALWITASIGMACGCGFNSLAVVSTIIVVSVLVLIRIFEKQFIHKGSKIIRRMSVSFFCSKEIMDDAYKKVLGTFESIYEIKQKNSAESDAIRKISFKLFLQTKNPIQYIHNELEKIEGIESISIQELYE